MISALAGALNLSKSPIPQCTLLSVSGNPPNRGTAVWGISVGEVMQSYVGLTFGRLTVTEVLKPLRNEVKTVKVMCTCACGSTYEGRLDRLLSGNTKSCGCIVKTAGGLGNTPEYKVWKEMHRRCGREQHRRYSEWGGRGIKVCASWLSFNQFLTDMGPRPGKGYSIDRIDNDKGYSPDNCRWATRTEQANNQSNNKLLTYRGRTQTMAQWCKELDLSYYVVRSRLNSQGLSVQEAFERPVKKK